MKAVIGHGIRASAMIAIVGILVSLFAIGAYGSMVDRSILDEDQSVESAGVDELMQLLSQNGISNPQELKVRSGDNSATLSWSAPKYLNGSALIGYIIQRSIDGGQWGNLTMVDAKTRMFTDRWVSNGQVVVYRIVAAGETGLSSPSNEASAKPMGLPWPPVSVTATVYGSSVIIEWKGPMYNGGAAITSYTIYRKADIDRDFKEIAKVDASVMTWTDGTVSGNSTVRYYVVAVNRAGSSGPSAISSVYDLPSDMLDKGSSGTGFWPYIVGGSAIVFSVVGSFAIWIRTRKNAPGPMPSTMLPIPYQAQCVQVSSVGACP
jgi:predicted phage tail protein